MTDRLTLNLGFRYDLVTGMRDRPVEEPELRRSSTGAATAGRVRRASPGFEDFGKTPQEDKNNFQPRVGAVLRPAAATARTSSAAAGAVYYDFGYTNANILFAAVNATGIGAGHGLQRDTTRTAIKNPDGSFFKVSDPISNIASAERGRRRAAAQLAHRVAAHQAAVRGSDVGRLVAPARRGRP